uniref:uncharacterized protein isoform X2 n=1 Tax=Myxine glutinosa TaxID=7769 RepID=UPI00358E7240
MSKRKSFKGKLAKIFSKNGSSSVESFDKPPLPATNQRRSWDEAETVSLFGENEFSREDTVSFDGNAQLSNVETRSLSSESGITTSGRLTKSWSFRRTLTPFRTLLPNSSSPSSAVESGEDGAEEERGVSVKDKKHEKPGQWAHLSRKKSKREVRQDTAEADDAGTCPDRRGVAPNRSVVKRLRNFLERGGNQPSLSDRSGNQQSLSDRGGNQQSLSDRSGNQRSLSDRSVNQRSLSDRSGNQQSLSDRGGNQRTLSDRSGNQRSLSDRSVNQRSLSDRGGNQPSLSDRSGNQQSLSDRGGNQPSLSDRSGNQQSLSDRGGNQPSLSDRSGNQQSLSDRSGNQPSLSDRSGNQQSLSDRGGNQRSLSDSVNPNGSVSRSLSFAKVTSELEDHSIRVGRSLDSAKGLGVDQWCSVGNSGGQVLEQDGVSDYTFIESDHDVFCESVDHTLVESSSKSTAKLGHVDKGQSDEPWRCEEDTFKLQSDSGNAGGRTKRSFSNYRSERKSRKHSEDEMSKSDTFPRERRRNQDKGNKMTVSELIKSFEQASRKSSTENFTGKEIASQSGNRREAAPVLSRNKNVSRSFKSKTKVQGVDDDSTLKEQVEVREEDEASIGVGVDASSPQEETAPASPANDATCGRVRHTKVEEEKEEAARRGACPDTARGNSTPVHTHAGAKQHQGVEPSGPHEDNLDFKSTIATPSECDCTEEGFNVFKHLTQLAPRDGTTPGVRHAPRTLEQHVDTQKASDAAPVGESVDWAGSSSPSPKKMKVLTEGNGEIDHLKCSSTLITRKFNGGTKINGTKPENDFSRESEAEQDVLPVPGKGREGRASQSKSYSGLQASARSEGPDKQTRNDTSPSVSVVPNEPASGKGHQERFSSMEIYGGAPVHRAETSGGAPVHRAETSGGAPVHHAETSGGAPVHHAETTGGAPVHHAETSGGAPVHHAETSEGAPVHHAETSGGAPVHHVETSGGAHVHHAETSGGAPVHPAETSGGAPVHHVETSGGAPVHHVETSGGAPVHHVETSGGAPVHHVETSGGAPVHHVETSGGAHVHHAETSGGAPVHHAKTSGGAPVHPAETSGGAPVHHVETSGGAPVHHAETSGGAPVHHAESSSKAEDGTMVTSIVQPKISRSQEKERQCNLPVSTSASSSITGFPKPEDLQTSMDKMLMKPDNVDNKIGPSIVSRFGQIDTQSESEMIPDNPEEMAKLLDVLNNIDDTENPIPYRKGAKVGPRRNPVWPRDQFLYPIREDSFLETLLEKDAKAAFQPKVNVTPKNGNDSQTSSTQCGKSGSYSRTRPSIIITRAKLAERPPREFKYSSISPQSSASKNVGLFKEHDNGESQVFDDHPMEGCLQEHRGMDQGTCEDHPVDGYLQEHQMMDQGTCEDHPVDGYLQEHQMMDQGTCEVNVPSQLCKCARHEDSYSLVGPRPGKIVLFEGPGRDGRRFDFWGDEPDCSQWKIRGDACLQVVRGCWIVYEKPNYLGQMAALEEGIAELAQLWGSGIPDATVGSLSLTIQNHSLPAILLFPEEHSRGRFTRYEQEESMLRTSTYSPGPASITVYTGTWLLYPRPHFEGCPLVLEPGFYPTRETWGADHCSVASLRPMVMGGLKVEHPNDFKMVVYDHVDFSGTNFEVFSERSHLNGMSVLSARVYGGVWVGYEQEGFEGRQFLLEEGMFSCYQCWGGRSIGLRSLRPLQSVHMGSVECSFKVEIFGDSEQPGPSLKLHDDCPQVPSQEGGGSLRVHAGRWVAYGEETFTGSMAVLEPGDTARLNMLIPGSYVRSLRVLPYEFSEPEIMLYDRSGLCGRQMSITEDTRSLSAIGYSQPQSILVTGGIWVACEHLNFQGRQQLLEEGDVLNWSQLSGWTSLGSLYHLKQPMVLFCLQSVGVEGVLTVVGTATEATAAQVQVQPYDGSDDQNWVYDQGYLRSQVGDLCLEVMGSRWKPGASVVAWFPQQKLHQKWRIMRDGLIVSLLGSNLVLSVKGGGGYDCLHVALAERQDNEPRQCWKVEMV